MPGNSTFIYMKYEQSKTSKNIDLKEEKGSSSEQFLHKLAGIMIERILDDMDTKELLTKIQSHNYE